MAQDKQKQASETWPGDLLTERALARRWRVSPRTLQRWRAIGTGPAFCRIGDAIRYRPSDIAAYEAAVRHAGDKDK